MPRPKRGTPEGDAATNKWRQTMLERFGGEEGLKTHLQAMGRAGGQKSRTGGFGANPEFAKICGRKGGKASRRKGNAPRKIIEKNQETIRSLYREGHSIPQISEHLDIGQSSLRNWAKENIPEYLETLYGE